MFTIKEARAFLHKLDEDIPDDEMHKKVILKFILLTGLCNGEMCGLKWSDIDFDKKIVHIRRNRLYSKQFGYYEKTPKTKTSVRDIPLTDALIGNLKKYMDWFRFADEEFDVRLDETYLAENVYRQPLYPQSIGQWLTFYERKWGMKHDLRHTYCSLLLAQNVPIQTVSKYMGHSDSTSFGMFTVALSPKHRSARSMLWINGCLEKRPGDFPSLGLLGQRKHSCGHLTRSVTQLRSSCAACCGSESLLASIPSQPDGSSK